MTIDIALHKSRNGCVSVYCHSSDPEIVKNVHLQIVIDAGLIQVVGIMPTLIIVQISVGQAVHDVGKPVRSNAPYPVAIKVDRSYQTSRSSDASLTRRDECHLSSNEPYSPSKRTFSSDKCGEAVDRVVAHTHVSEQGEQFQTDLESNRDIDYTVRGDNGEGKDHRRSSQ